MRFAVSYRILAASGSEARARAEAIALEQTVEVPRDVVPAGFVADTILGRVEEIGPEGADSFRATISYAAESAGGDIAQFLNVVFGNSSIQRGLRVAGIALGDTLSQAFPGPRFGIAGMRRLTGRGHGGLIVPVLKPMGLGPDDLARIAYLCARAGADIIKDDHGLADQPFCRFRARVDKVAAAVARANAETGGQAVYVPNLAGAPGDIDANLRFARDAGARGILILPGLHGFGLVTRVATDPALNLAVMTHPALLGPHVLTPATGFDHGVMFGTLQRIAGADISVFPNVGGRFGFSQPECHQIADACRAKDGPGAAILPSPGGGMSVDRAADMVAMYGQDTAYLLGGSLLRLGDQIGEGIRAMRQALNAAEATAHPAPLHRL